MRYGLCPNCDSPIDFKPQIAVAMCENREHFLTLYGLALTKHHQDHPQCESGLLATDVDHELYEERKKNIKPEDTERWLGGHSPSGRNNDLPIYTIYGTDKPVSESSCAPLLASSWVAFQANGEQDSSNAYTVDTGETLLVFTCKRPEGYWQIAVHRSDLGFFSPDTPESVRLRHYPEALISVKRKTS